MWKKKQIVRKIVRRKKKRQDPSKLGEPPNLKKERTRNAVPFARARAKLGGMWKRRLIGTGYAYFNVVSHPATVHAQFEISAQSEHFWKFDLWPLCDPLITSNELQNIFRMLKMS